MVPGLRRSASTWCEARTELIAPASDRFVADDNPALEQQFFDITQAEPKPEIPAYGATDDYRRRAMAVVTQFRILHPTILLDHLLNVTVPGRGAIAHALTPLCCCGLARASCDNGLPLLLIAQQDALT